MRPIPVTRAPAHVGAHPAPVSLTRSRPPRVDAAAAEECSSSSRRALILGIAAVCAWEDPRPAAAAVAETSTAAPARPLAGGGVLLPGRNHPGPDLAITHKVYLDIGIAPTALKPAGERTLGDKSSIPIEDAEPTGRIVIGLYGRHVPATVDNFLRLVRSGALQGTTFSRVLPGEYIQAGQQGQRRMGQLEPPPDVQLNTDVSSSGAFRLTHSRPGTVSLSLSENDDDPRVKTRPGYGNLEFLITTGPGPVPRLDGLNIPFGKVVEGMGVVNAITLVPTFKVNERTSALNLLAGQLGDDRAAGVRRKYGRPFKAVVILGAGELPLEEDEEVEAA